MDTVIGPKVRLRGDVYGCTNLEIHGELDGTTEIDGLVVVRKSGKFSGQIKANDAVVEGSLDGSIDASGKVEIGDTAHVTGDISARSIAIAEGSFFEGKVQMAGDQRKEGKRSIEGQLSFEEKRTS